MPSGPLPPSQNRAAPAFAILIWVPCCFRATGTTPPSRRRNPLRASVPAQIAWDPRRQNSKSNGSTVQNYRGRERRGRQELCHTRRSNVANTVVAANAAQDIAFALPVPRRRDAGLRRLSTVSQDSRAIARGQSKRLHVIAQVFVGNCTGMRHRRSDRAHPARAPINWRSAAPPQVTSVLELLHQRRPRARISPIPSSAIPDRSGTDSAIELPERLPLEVGACLDAVRAA